MDFYGNICIKYFQGSHKIQQQQLLSQQPLQSQQVKAVVHSQSGLSDSGTVTDTATHCRHSGKQSRKLLVAELEKIKKENEKLKNGKEYFNCFRVIVCYI